MTKDQIFADKRWRYWKAHKPHTDEEKNESKLWMFVNVTIVTVEGKQRRFRLFQSSETKESDYAHHNDSTHIEHDILSAKGFVECDSKSNPKMIHNDKQPTEHW